MSFSLRGNPASKQEECHRDIFMKFMKKFILILISVLIFLFMAEPVSADMSVVTGSAIFKQESIEKTDYRSEKLRKFLEEYDSELSPYARQFVKYADEYGLDWRLLPAIAGIESTFGKQMIDGTYNAYGWAGGKYRFASWEDSIATISKSLKDDYLEKGAVTLFQIAHRYCPPSTTWRYKVVYFMNKIDPIPLDFTL
jgi:hypothetical protein